MLSGIEIAVQCQVLRADDNGNNLMAIRFTGNRNLTTDVLPHMGSNVPVFSQSFRIKVNQSGGLAGGVVVNVLTRVIQIFKHQFWSSASDAGNLNVQLNGPGGVVQANVNLVQGSVYVICLVWDGVTPVQMLYLSAIPQTLGHIVGNTTNRIDSIQLGPLSDQTNFDFEVDDYWAWDNYALTSTDAGVITNNGDPSVIGPSATWRGHYSLQGTVGAAVQIGDPGTMNSFGSGGDFTTLAGSGSATYTDPLVWAPTVTSTPYVTGCSKLISTDYILDSTGNPVVPSQIFTIPNVIVNGTNLGALVKQWFTGGHYRTLWALPGNISILPTDIVELDAPIAWANTPAGPVAALSGPILNLAGKSSVGADTLTKRLRFGYNHPAPGGLEYYPFNNAKFKLQGAYGYGKLPPNVSVALVNQPCEAGLIRICWDATNPTTPNIFDLYVYSASVGRVTVTHRPEYDISPADGIGFVRVFEVEYIQGSDYLTAVGGSTIMFRSTDPVSTGGPHYNNLLIQLAGEWDTTDFSVPDRSDLFAPSLIYQERVKNMGSGRGVDMTCCGGACDTFPRPELLPSPNQEIFWGYTPIVTKNTNFTSIGPVDTIATPWIYSAQFKEPECQYQATLSQPINSTPPSGTNETYTFSDGDTAPLMVDLELQIDSEIMRIVSGFGTSWTIARGSNGTTPATHAAGVVTVFGRQPITKKVHPDGTAPYTAPAFIQCDAPHHMTTMYGYIPQGILPPILMDDGSTDSQFKLATCYITGPTSFMSIWSGWYPSKPNGTKPAGITSLNPPGSNYAQLFYYPRMPLEVFCDLISRQPNAALHYNIPLDACDDLIYKQANIALQYWPDDGRPIFLEYCNEPWNWAPPFRSNLYCTLDARWLMMPQSLNTYDLAYYSYRGVRCAQIFDDVFGRAGRGSQIKFVANCQMNSGPTQVTPHLNQALGMGRPYDAISCAPYFSLGTNAQTVAAFNSYDDDQACELLLHDITFDTTNNIPPWLANVKEAVDAYNTANNQNCILICYEGSFEHAADLGPRNHDIQYNPNFYDVWRGWMKILQDGGVQFAHIYGLGIGWPQAWGNFHARTQLMGYGLGGPDDVDNRAFKINGMSGDINSTALWQDCQVRSVRGKATRDWNDDVESGSVTVGREYFIAPNPGSGSGTLRNPYGLDDLQVYVSDGGINQYWAPGPAITNLQPDDTLLFRGGNYPIQGVAWDGGFNNTGQRWALGPTTSGTAGHPITIRSYPGEVVVITQISDTYQPIFGNFQSYIRYLGLEIHQTTGDTTYQVLPVFDLTDSSHNEVGYCKLVGHTWLSDTGDNHELIQLASSSPTPFSCENNWIHHNEMSGVKNQSNSHNAAAIKFYSAGPNLIEDNYIHDCTFGVYQKQGGMSAQPPGYQVITYRRNYIVNNYGCPILGPGQGGTVQQATMLIYDNVFDDTIQTQDQQVGTQIYNNLWLNVTQAAGNDYSKPCWLFIVDYYDPGNVNNRAVYQTQIWNNVVLPSVSLFIPFQQQFQDFVPLADPHTPLSYMDYNVYTASINYYYFNTPFTSQFDLAGFQAVGAERNTTVVADPTVIYPGIESGDYTLATFYRTAGRYGDAVGPRVPISGTGGIMDLTRYGPGALSISPPPIQTTSYAFTAPSPATGPINQNSELFTVTPNGPLTGTIIITPSGGGLSTPIVLTFTDSAVVQSFIIIPTEVGTVTLTPTNNSGLTDPPAVTYDATASTSSTGPPSSRYRIMTVIKDTVTEQAFEQKGLDIVWYRDPGEVSDFINKDD
jgi:hypothetical protein